MTLTAIFLSFTSLRRWHDEDNQNDHDDDIHAKFSLSLITLMNDGSVSKVSICAKKTFSEVQVGGKIHRCMEANSSMANSVSNLQLFTMIRIEINYNFSRNSSSSSSQHAYRFFSKHSRKQHKIEDSFEHRKRSMDHHWLFTSSDEKERVFHEKRREMFRHHLHPLIVI